MPVTSGGWRRALASVSAVVALVGASLGFMPASDALLLDGDVYTAWASTPEDGEHPGGASRSPAVSEDGRYIAFVSMARLHPADQNTFADVYRKDMQNGGAVQLVSAGPAWTNSVPGNGSSGGSYVGMSDDGRYIVFASDANNLLGADFDTGAPFDSNNRTDIFRKDMDTGDVVRVNQTANGMQVAWTSDFFSVSADGNRIAWIALPGGPNIGAGPGVYVNDLAGASQTWLENAGTPAPLAISGDGNVVAYSRSNDTVCGASPTYTLRYYTFSPIALVSNLPTASSNFCNPSGVLGPDALSHDGLTLALWSDGDACCDNTLDPKPRAVYAWNKTAANNDTPNSLRRVSETQGSPAGTTWAAFGGTNGNADSAAGAGWPKGAISADGRKVLFTSTATNLDPTAPNGGAFVKDLDTGAIAAKSLNNNNQSPAAAPVDDASLNPAGTVVAFTTATSFFPEEDTNGSTDVYVRYPPATPTDLALTAEVESTKPGFSMLNSEAVPATALPLDALGDVSGTPLRSIDLASTPLRSIPLRSIPLRSITLSELPLQQGTWEAILATIPGDPYKGVPLQAITLDEVLATNADMSSVTLGNVDLASTPLRSISVSSILLGATPLRSIPVGDGVDNFGDWCAVLAGLGYSCTDLGLTGDSSVLAVDLAGVPLRSIPLRSIPLRSIPLRSIDLESAPLRSIPLRSIRYGGELGSMPLSAIRDKNTDGTLGASNPGLLITCSALAGGTCDGKTLTDATNANAFIVGKTLGDLVDHVDPAAITGSLGELIASIIDSANYPWEDLPLDGLQPFAGDFQRTVTYNAEFTTMGVGSQTATVKVTLPPGFRYVDGSTDNYSDGTVDEPTTVETLPGNVQRITWEVFTTGGDSENVPFLAYPGFDLATDAASDLTVSIGSASATITGQAPVDVVEDFELPPINIDYDYYCGMCGEDYYLAPPAIPTGAPIIQANHLVASHIGSSGDVDYFRIPVPEKGTRMNIRLGNHSTDADFDVAMFNTSASTPLRSIPLRSIPLRSIPLADNGVDATAADSAVSPETLNDIPNIESAPLRSIGENRGTHDELISTVSNAEPESGEQQQYYTLQVTAFNGGSSVSPYVLYVSTYQPPPPPDCPAPKSFAFAGQGTAGTAPTLPENLNTLFLVNKKRLGDTWGSAEADAALAKLATLAGSSALGVIGAVYPVESDTTTAGAYGNWDLNPCSVEAANEVFTSVSGLVDQVRQERPTLKNIVVVGGDDIVPMARVADYTQISNESDYGSALLLENGTDKGTPLAAAAITQNILTDDPLGDIDPIPWLDHALYVPDLAVGRLVETPAEIAAQVDQFINAQGRLSAQTSLTTGYDFLSDGAEAVDAALAGGIPDATKRAKLVNETWSKADVLAALFPATGTPDVATVNAHYDHNRALPALGNSTHDESDLVTAQDIAANPLLTKKLLFTMGCHGGLSVPKSYTDTAANDVDWAQTYAQRGAAVYLANTGYGYGDTAAVALSEELMRQFASRLDGSMTVGEAAVYAKQAYFGQLGAYGPYDEKAMQEATLYGLPMWKIGEGTTAPAAPAEVAPVADADGILSHPLSLDPSFTKKTSKGGGTYYETSEPTAAATGLQVTQYRPIEPRFSVDVTAPEGTVAHGVLITDLQSRDEGAVPAMARPVIDLSANEPPPPAGDVSFPTTFQNLTAFNTPAGQRQHVVFMPGQFFRDSSWSNAGGVQRLFESINAEVKYSESTDFTAPTISNVTSSVTNGVLTVSLLPTDNSTVVRVLVLVKDGSGNWTPLELTEDANTGVWSGTMAVSSLDIELFAQALDDNGNVGVTTNKGRYYTGVPEVLSPAGLPDLELTPGEATGTNGWFRSTPSVSLQGSPGVSYTTTKSHNGGAATTTSLPAALSADGTYLLKTVGADGSNDVLAVAVDKTAPTFTGAAASRAPNANGWYNAPVSVTAGSCSDATSGVQSCPGAKTYSADGVDIGPKAFDFAGNSTSGPVVNLDQVAPEVAVQGVEEGVEYQTMPNITCSVTDALSGPDGCTGSVTTGQLSGFYTYTAVGKDKAGNSTVKQVNFKVKYVFSGFLQPINDTAHSVDQTYSIFSGGSTVPFKFTLTRDGQPVQATSTPVFLTPKKLGPLGGTPPNEITTLETPSSGYDFAFDGQKYQYNWKTDKKLQGGYYWKVGVLLDGVQYTVIIGLK